MTNWGVPMLQDQYSEGTLTPNDVVTVMIPTADPATLFIARQIIQDEIGNFGRIVPMEDAVSAYSIMVVSPTEVRPVKGFRQAMERLADYALFTGTPDPRCCLSWSYGLLHTTVAHADAGEVL